VIDRPESVQPLAGAVVPLAPPVVKLIVRTLDISIASRYQFHVPYGLMLWRVCSVVYEPVPDAIAEEPPGTRCHRAPSCPFQSAGPNRKGGTEPSGERYATNPPDCFAHEPSEPPSRICTDAIHGAEGRLVCTIRTSSREVYMLRSALVELVRMLPVS
jgi:hypothetical protein